MRLKKGIILNVQKYMQHPEKKRWNIIIIKEKSKIYNFHELWEFVTGGFLFRDFHSISSLCLQQSFPSNKTL